MVYENHNKFERNSSHGMIHGVGSTFVVTRGGARYDKESN